MMANKLISGKLLSSKIEEKLKEEVLNIQGRKPCLAIINVGDDAASAIYVRNKLKCAERIGIDCEVIRVCTAIRENQLLSYINGLNKDRTIDGIIVQLPLPESLNKQRILDEIIQEKDVDGLSSLSVARLYTSKPDLNSNAPCTPFGILELIKEMDRQKTGKERELSEILEDKNVVVVGRSNIVGAPVARLLQNFNATVTIAHSKTKNLSELTKMADIVISATGVPGLIKKGYLKKNAWIIDAGISRNADNKIVGDVLLDEVIDTVEFITPVPSGVGPMTVISLMRNTVESYKERAKGWTN